MARKRPNVAKKRVVKKATAKNASFVEKFLPELQQMESSLKRRDNKPSDEVSIDIKSVEESGRAMVTLPGYNFVNHFCAGDIDMPGPSSSSQLQPIERTYSRKKSINELLRDWDTVPSASESGIQIVQIDSLNDKGNLAGSSLQECVIVEAQSKCSCGKADDVAKYKALAESLQNEKTALLLKNGQLEAQNAKLLESLTSKLLPTPEKPFKEEEGFVDTETMQRMSHEAGDKDYLFLKFLMIKLFPEGLVGRSVTGRSSNNPSGRPKKNAIPEEMSLSIDEATSEATEVRQAPKVPLDPIKVRWIKRRLYDRRIFLRDDCA